MDGDNTAPTIEQQIEPQAAERPLSLLYGKPEPEPEPESDPAPDDEGEVDPDSGEGQEAGQQEPSGDEGEGETVSTLAELFEAKELDADFVDTLTTTVKVDGVTTEVTLKDLKANFQMNSAAENRLEKANAKLKETNEAIARINEEANAQIAIGAKLIKRVEDTLIAEMGAMDWNALKESDPAEWSAKKLEFQERRDVIEAWKREAREEIQESIRQHQEEARANLAKEREQQSDLLLKALPEWADEKKAETERGKLAKYLLDQGFPKEDVFTVIDHRMIVIAEKARRYDEIQSKASAAGKKVVKVPKVVKPGAKATQPTNPQPKNRAEILYGTA